MKKNAPALFFVMLLLLSGGRAVSQISVTGNLSGEELAAYLAGPGVEISNVTYSYRSMQAGKFINNRFNSNLKLDSGIVLTTGRAFTDRNEIGTDGLPPQLASNVINQPGDADIDRILSQLPFPNPPESDNACVLEFDFIPTGDTIRFNYVFASDEYPEFNCTQFTDMFLFYISGPGITGKKNIALIPGTNIPVAINSINDGTVSPNGDRGLCAQLGAGSPFTQYYVDNRTGPNIVYNGMTKILTAIHPVTPCRLYHIKLVIADVSDAEYDSGIFLEAGSLTSDFARLDYTGDVPGEASIVEGCDTATVTVRYFKKVDAPKTIRLYTGGTADNFSDFDLRVPATVTIPAGDSIVTFPLHALQDNFTEGDEELKIYVAANPCSVNDPIYTDSISIALKEFKTILVSPPIAGICPGNQVQLEVINPGQFSGGFAWSPAAGLSNTGIYNPFASPDTSTHYFINSSYSATCRGRGVSFVEVKDTGSVTITKTDVTCQASNGTITVTPGVTWVNPRFSLNGGPFTTSNIFTGLAVGNYTVTVLDAGGCRADKTVSIIQLPNVRGTLTLVTASCNGDNGTVIIHARDGQPGYEYSLNGVIYQADSVFNNTNAGPITAYIRDASGCIATIPFVLGFDPPISFTWVVTPDGCRGLPDGTITITPTGGSGSNYRYSANGGVSFQPGNVLQVTAGLHSVWVEDEKGCLGQQDITVPLNNTVTAHAGRDTVICEGAGALLTATSNALKLLWTPNTGLSADTVLNPVASPSVTTVYTLTATSGLCERKDSAEIIVNPAPVANAGTDLRICFGKTAQLNGSGPGGFVWYPNQHINNRYIPNPVVSPRSSASYWLHVTDGNGCRSLLPDTVLVEVIPPVKAFAGNDTIVAVGQPLQLNALPLISGAQYNWSPASGLSGSTIASPVATLQNHQQYLLTVTTPEGCMGQDIIDIKVYTGPEIYVPTAFSPNNDGVNDVLLAIPAGIKTFEYFRVFNRWGKEVFSTTSYRNGWDGRLRGTEQGTDTYVWVARGVDYNGKVVLRKGSVVLVR